MNLLDITLQYLECEPEEAGLAFLNSLVKDAGMPKSLIKHIVGCRKQCKVSHQGTYETVPHMIDVGSNDVNVWVVRSYFPEIPSWGPSR